MRVSSELLMREIAGEHLLVPVGATALRIHGMITLSESGVLLWTMLQNTCTKQELVDAVLREYDVDAHTAQQDVDAFLEKLDELGLLLDT